MIVLVEIRNSQGALLSLPLGDISSGYSLQDIDGLDPVNATIVSSSFAKVDGTQYHTSRRESRNLIFKIGLESDYAVVPARTLRKRLYNFFMPKTEVQCKLYDDDGLVVDISGRVESFQSKLFAKEPGVDISVICFDPDFIDLNPIELSGMSTSGTEEVLIDYDGDVETGIQFVLKPDRALTGFSIYHRPPDGSVRTLEFAGVLLEAGDTLKISTTPGLKEATLTRANTMTFVAYGVSPQSSWIELFNGDNYIRVYAAGAGIPYDISYLNRYGGL